MIAADERPVFRQHAQCAWCSDNFEIKAPMQRFCGDRCRYRAREEGRKTSPEYVLKTRARCRAWSAEKRGVTRVQPWLLGAPPYEAHLPGGFLEIHSDTPLRWPLEHRNVRGLHGAITALSGEGHDPLLPRFALIPWHRGIGWGVYFAESPTLDVMKGTRHDMRLYDQVLRVRFGGAARLKAPRVDKRGRRRIRVDTLTPVCTRTMQSKITHMRASGPTLLSTLCAWLPRRLGISFGDDDARLEIAENDTHAAHVQLGGKYGTVSGWSGSLVVECNAPVEWMLRAAEVLGLGGRVAMGFGRIRVSGLQN